MEKRKPKFSIQRFREGTECDKTLQGHSYDDL